MTDRESRITTDQAIENLKEIKSKYTWSTGADDALDMGIIAIRALKAEHKQGHWKQISPARIYECSECGGVVMTDDIDVYNFCHHCGCRMVEPQESEGKE